jgi:hypothetical protein
MGIVVKPFTFVAGVGNKIRAAEMNSNLDTLYNLVNGNLDAANLAANAVNTSEIADDAVTPAKLLSSDILACHALGISASVGTSGTLEIYSDLAFTLATAGAARIIVLLDINEFGATGGTSYQEYVATQVDALGFVEDAGFNVSADANPNSFLHTHTRLVTGLSSGAHTVDVRLRIGANPVTCQARGGMVLVLAA